MPPIIPKFNILQKYVTAENLKDVRARRNINALREGRESTRFEREGELYPIKKKTAELNLESAKFQSAEQAVGFIKNNAQFIDWTTYADSREYILEKLGAGAFFTGTLFPEPAKFLKQVEENKKTGSGPTTAVEVFNKWKTEILAPALLTFEQKIDARKVGVSETEAGTKQFKAETERMEIGQEEKPDEFKIRKELKDVEKARKALQKTGGLSDILFTLLSESNPDKAAGLKGSPEEIANYLKEWEDWLRLQLPGAGTEVMTETTPAAGKAGKVHEWAKRFNKDPLNIRK